MDIYAQNILEHYKNPFGKGSINNASVMHTEKNPSCGDLITIYLQIDDNVITKLTWAGDGCAISQAAMSMLHEELEGKTIDEALALQPQFILELLGLEISERRMKCALLCLHTIYNTIHMYNTNDLQSWNTTLSQLEM
jgi:nitrogen fixation NifU-like protein